MKIATGSEKIGVGIISFAHGHVNTYCSKLANFDDANIIICWDDNQNRGKT